MSNDLIAQAVMSLVMSLALTAEAHSAQIGVYYYPGWSPNIQHARFQEPWAPIKAFPARMPEAGPYNDTDPSVLRRQLDEMAAGSISYVVFDTYFGPMGQLRQRDALDAYLSVAQVNDPKFAIMWANHDKFLMSSENWYTMIDQVLQLYLQDHRYFTFLGKPAFFIFSADLFKKQAELIQSSTAVLLGWAQARAQEVGLPGISFVAGSDPNVPMISSWAKSAGYAAISNYNIGAGSGKEDRIPGYPGRDKRYQEAWDRYYMYSDLPVILPITVGWDRKPWGGSSPVVEDESQSTPAEFRAHLTAALQKLASASPNERIGVICCWNEYGEGSVLEPTVEYGRRHLEVLREVLRGG